ncbi:coiled-coil domain-containing protein 68 isoform X1 [Alligator mississippiensis]|uniref:Coiled-coil domain-containing protein 68 isoform B n=2 Tax=Alligator mississippiensis TaxID=8496 RepID=A0A151MWP2_ALLMI|nr:coiled-coil domain-containing protein 68 isoform X1 [Alligator mississippiensis]KYO28922.1 coiled-coil domain-containing protein 68 isoform B [Alligator mississippiensis]
MDGAGLSLPAEQHSARIMTTTLVLTERITREDRGSDGNYLLYGSSCAQISEETEYVKKVRSTLAKIQNQQPLQASDGTECEKDALSSSYDPIMAKMKETDKQLACISRENEILKIKLEATREAGAESLRHASRRLYENYQRRSEELKKGCEEDKRLMQASNIDREQKLKQNAENVSCLTERLEEKYSRIAEMERLVQRMEEEKKTLLEKKRSFEEMLLHMISNHEDAKRCVDLQEELFTLQQQIRHLQNLILFQNQDLRGAIQEIEELNRELKIQDKTIEDLKEKINMLEAQNKLLKYKVEVSSVQSTMKVSKAVSTDSTRIAGLSPYMMVASLQKQNG